MPSGATRWSPRCARAGPGRIRLRKDTSNLFRDRAKHAGSALDARAFAHVLAVDRGDGASTPRA
jgi:hypothetical protein